jgi:hypothetical protein
MFMLTPVDEKVTPLNGMLKGLSIVQDFTYTLAL